MGRYVGAFLTAVAVVAVAFCITWALVFCTPFFGHYSDGGYLDLYQLDRDGYTKGDWSSSGGGFGDTGRLILREPVMIQRLLPGLYAELLKMPNDELYILRSVDDPCLTFDCNGVPTKTIKPFIEAAIAHKQAVETATIGWRGLFVAIGSSIISFFSLIVAFAALLKRRT